eukprot:CAMPEP_0115836254 /NCGR_PEP_ID=MMETSP0287-20121206/4614_1 /TAXON_ID=412157 /ORGANISM="Chrysochromulina rotalis, Strain UIO044" /LENGTH=330 /DNA_ID=CAMNT_0003289735 /DNA_START=17 /DNA_END=1009 /DNA_ORIENTATION=+
MRVSPPIMQLQGGSRRTWSYGSHGPGPMDQMHVTLGSDGRPVDAEFELWQGPGNTPVKSRVYGDDGYSRPVYASVGMGGRSYTNTASIRNAGPLEFPINADMRAGRSHGMSPYQQRGMRTTSRAPMEVPLDTQRIQGGALRTFTIDPSIGSVVINLRSEGMPITAKIEILQGPNSDRQGIDLYSDDGLRKPVSYLLELPGFGSTISITNSGPIAYPLTASIIPYGPQRRDSAYNEAYGMMNGGMMGSSMMGGVASNRYGIGGRYSAQLADGTKWHERGQNKPNRGPPPSFADMQGSYEDPDMMDDFDNFGYDGPPPGARYPGGPRVGAYY